MTHPTHRLAALTAALLLPLTMACSSNDNQTSDPITTQVLEAEPDADTNDIATDIDYIQTQAPDASDTQIADWIIEVIQWNNCLDANPTGEDCTPISPDNPRNW